MVDFKKLLIIVSTFIICVSAPFSVYAAEEDERPSQFAGKIGDNASYSISVTYGTETDSNGYVDTIGYMDVEITGSGSTYDYKYYNDLSGHEDEFSPIVYANRVVWGNVDYVKSTVSIQGVTGLGNNLFRGMWIGNTNFLNGVETIGEYTFL